MDFGVRFSEPWPAQVVTYSPGLGASPTAEAPASTCSGSTVPRNTPKQSFGIKPKLKYRAKDLVLDAACSQKHPYLISVSLRRLLQSNQSIKLAFQTMLTCKCVVNNSTGQCTKDFPATQKRQWVRWIIVAAEIHLCQTNRRRPFLLGSMYQTGHDRSPHSHIALGRILTYRSNRIYVWICTPFTQNLSGQKSNGTSHAPDDELLSQKIRTSVTFTNASLSRKRLFSSRRYQRGFPQSLRTLWMVCLKTNHCGMSQDVWTLSNLDCWQFESCVCTVPNFNGISSSSPLREVQWRATFPVEETAYRSGEDIGFRYVGPYHASLPQHRRTLFLVLRGSRVSLPRTFR